METGWHLEKYAKPTPNESPNCDRGNAMEKNLLRTPTFSLIPLHFLKNSNSTLNWF